MEYFAEVLDRKTGELVTISQGEWITISELGEAYGLGPKEIRTVLVKMELLQPEGTRDHTRYRLAPWAVEAGLGRRIERKGKIPFDTISPLGQAWVSQRWDGTVAALEDAKTSDVREATRALQEFQSQRNAYRKSFGAEEMTSKEMIYWVADHYPSLSQPEIAQVVHVSQPLVNRILMDRRKRLDELRARRDRPLG